MASLGEIRAALGGLLESVPDLRVYPVLPDSVVVPCAIIQPGSPFADYQRRMGRSRSTLWRFNILLMVARLEQVSAQNLLDEWVSPGSPVLAVLDGGDVPDGVVSVVSGQEYGPVEVGATRYLAASLVVEVDA